MYTCPNCKETNDAKSWNETTFDACGGRYEIEPIDGKEREEAFYFCPNCGAEVDGYSVIEEATNHE